VRLSRPAHHHLCVTRSDSPSGQQGRRQTDTLPADSARPIVASVKRVAARRPSVSGFVDGAARAPAPAPPHPGRVKVPVPDEVQHVPLAIQQQVLQVWEPRSRPEPSAPRPGPCGWAGPARGPAGPAPSPLQRGQPPRGRDDAQDPRRRPDPQRHRHRGDRVRRRASSQSSRAAAARTCCCTTFCCSRVTGRPLFRLRSRRSRCQVA